MLKVHYFDFWTWVERQAHPQAFVSSDRYGRIWNSTWDQLVPGPTAESMGHPEQTKHDRYAR